MSDTLKQSWIKFIKTHKAILDLLSADIDDSHTPAIRGVSKLNIREEKSARPQALYLTGRQGLPLAMSEPISGNHNDLYDIEIQFEVITATLEEANTPSRGGISKCRWVSIQRTLEKLVIKKR